jgi:STE24 endopeptidase
LFLIWMGWRADEAGPREVVAAWDVALFFGMYAFLVGMLGLWSRLLTRRLELIRLERAISYFRGVMFAARAFVPIWFAVGVFFLGWGRLVQIMLSSVAGWPVLLPGALIGILPPILAWAGLWWAQYPADHALRERRLMVDFNDGLQLFRPPPLREYLASHVRIDILFAAIPVLLILGLHDAIMMVLWRGFDLNVTTTGEGLIMFACALSVLIVAPRLLVMILSTEPLPPSPLRDRMEAMARAHRMRFRDIRIWRTENRIFNALVMGVVPQFRYVLLSDLLLEELKDEQIEAVFAHELGHVVHRHLIWYIVFLKLLVLILALIDAAVGVALARQVTLPAWMPLNLVMTLIGIGGFLLGLGYVSRRFERQADVFAARTLQRYLAPLMPDAAGYPAAALSSRSGTPRRSAAEPLQPSEPSHVGPLGASLFASALERVAVVNNMPLHPRAGGWAGGPMQRLGYVVERGADLAGNWLHGSIPHRMRTLHRMSSDPRHTFRFDRRMARLYVTMVVALVISGAAAWYTQAPL